jgi:hypothetical protein
MKDEHTTILRLKQFVSPPPVGAVGDSCEQAGDSAESIGQMASQVVHEVSRSNPPPIVPKTGPMPAPSALLKVLTYCYAKGIYSSDQIERKLWDNPSLRMNHLDDLPTADTLRRFRRMNRPLLLCALETLLRRVRHAFLRSHEPMNPAERTHPVGNPEGLEHLLEDSGNTTIVVRHEAAQRLEQAAMLDSRSLDE